MTESTAVTVEHTDDTTRVWLGDREITDLVDSATFWSDGDRTDHGHRLMLNIVVDEDQIARVETVAGNVRWDGLTNLPTEALVYELKRRQSLPGGGIEALLADLFTKPPGGASHG